MNTIAKIIKTKMYPCQFHLRYQKPFAANNSTHLFFRTIDEAVKYAETHKIKLV